MHAQHFVWEQSIYDSCRFNIGHFGASRIITQCVLHLGDTFAQGSGHNNAAFLTLRVIHELKMTIKPRNDVRVLIY